MRETSLQGFRSDQPGSDALHFRVCTNASFASNENLYSEHGVLISICNGLDSCRVLDYRSYNFRRVVRSIMGGNECAFMGGFGCVYTISNNCNFMTNMQLPVIMYSGYN